MYVTVTVTVGAPMSIRRRRRSCGNRGRYSALVACEVRVERMPGVLLITRFSLMSHADCTLERSGAEDGALPDRRAREQTPPRERLPRLQANSAARSRGRARLVSAGPAHSASWRSLMTRAARAITITQRCPRDRVEFFPHADLSHPSAVSFESVTVCCSEHGRHSFEKNTKHKAKKWGMYR